MDSNRTPRITDTETGEQLATPYLLICSSDGKQAWINSTTLNPHEIPFTEYSDRIGVGKVYESTEKVYSILSVTGKYREVNPESVETLLEVIDDSEVSSIPIGFVVEGKIQGALPKTYEAHFKGEQTKEGGIRKVEEPIPEDDIPF